MIDIDLLSGHPAQADGALPRRRLMRPDPMGIVLLLAVLTIPTSICVLWMEQRSQAAALAQRLEAAQADSARFAQLRAVGDSLQARSADLLGRTALIERLDRGRFRWPRLLDEVGRALPPAAWLTSLRRISPPPEIAVEIQGVADSPLTVTEFIGRLTASPQVDQVEILASRKQSLAPEAVARQAFTIVIRPAEADETDGALRPARTVAP